VGSGLSFCLELLAPEIHMFDICLLLAFLTGSWYCTLQHGM
jgi:hypothetical protein